ncbi:MAG: hypothetical protein ACFFC7_31540 [Candidatus Hermodarchaeota archaeon]
MSKIPDLYQIIAILAMIIGFVIGLAGGLLIAAITQLDYNQVTDPMNQVLVPLIVGLLLLVVGAGILVLGNKLRLKLLGY